MKQDYEEWRNACKKETEYVIKNKDEIRQVYGQDFIAVKDCGVIDHDKNEFNLAKRIDERFGNEFVLISSLEGILNPKVVDLPSPESN